MNKFDYALCIILFNFYLLFLWVAPLNITDIFDNRWINVIAFHVGALFVVGFLFIIGYAASKSNNFRG